MKFKSSNDSLVTIVSLSIICLTLYFFFLEFAGFRQHQQVDFASFISIFKTTIILLPTLAISYFLSVRSYFLFDDAVVIKKRLGMKNITFNEIKSIERIYYSKAYIRLFAVGGLFGYNGIYLSKSSKIVYLYTNHKKDLIRINRYNKPAIFISPDNTKQFAEICQSKKLVVLDEC